MDPQKEAIKREFTRHTTRALKNLSLTDLDAFAEDYDIMRTMMRHNSWLEDPFAQVFNWARKNYLLLDPPEKRCAEAGAAVAPPPVKITVVKRAGSLLFAAQFKEGKGRGGKFISEIWAFTSEEARAKWLAAGSLRAAIHPNSASRARRMKAMVRVGVLLVWKLP